MKFFNKAKKWLVSTLCASLCLSGALAISTLNVKATEGSSTTTVSSDIQMLVDSFNASLGGKSAYVTAEYVHNFTMSNGAVASGILLTQDITSSTSVGLYTSDLRKVDGITFDVSKFTGDTPMFSYIIAPVTGEEYYSKADRYIPNASNPNAFNSAEFSIGIANVGNMSSWVVYNNDDVDASVPDAAGNPSNGVRLHTYNAAGSAKDNRGCYYDGKAGYLVGTRGYAPISFDGNQTTPFSVYYDYATNVVYKDKHPTNTHTSADHRLLGFPNVQPQDFGALASTFDTKYCGKTGFNLDAYTGSTTFSNNVDGFANGKAQIAIRMGTIRGTKLSVLLTNVMGLDLSNPNNTFDSNNVVLSADDIGAPLNKEFSVPAPTYKTFAGVVSAKTFDGTVDIYKGERSYKGVYGSYGSTMASLADDTALTLLAEDVAVGANYTFTELGKYPLVYTDTEGNVAYSTLSVFESVKVSSIDSVNTTVTINGGELTTDTEIKYGDVLKFTANDDYTLYSFESDDSENERIIINDVAYKLNENDEYVVGADFLGLTDIKIISAAYSAEYTITLKRLGGGSDSVTNVYKGINCSYYRYGNAAWRKPSSSLTVNGVKDVYGYYEMLHYDGENLWYLKPLGSNSVANSQVTGAALINTDTSEPLGIIKQGNVGANKIPLAWNVTIDPIVTRSMIKTAGIKTKGTLGLQVKVYIEKAAYDKFTTNYVSYAKGNDVGFESTQNQDVQVVVVKGEYFEELSQIVDVSRDIDDSYGYIGLDKDEHASKIATITVDKWAADEEVGGVVYKVCSIVMPINNPEDYNKSYYVGGIMNFGSCTGGDFVRLGKASKTSMIEHSVKDATIDTFMSIASNTEGKFSYVIDEETVLYSNTLISCELKELFVAYCYTAYYYFVSTEEVAGYTKHSTKDIWYNANNINESGVDMLLEYIEI